MTWRYQQSTGKLWRDAVFEGQGYSGHGAGLNNHAEETVHGVGPIPCGQWTIGRPKDPPDHLGPLAMPLTPKPGNDAHGRSAFYIHGDNQATNKTASDGCVILARQIRQQIAESGDHDLTVVP